jgi:hypothetical protein
VDLDKVTRRTDEELLEMYPVGIELARKYHISDTVCKLFGLDNLRDLGKILDKYGVGRAINDSFVESSAKLRMRYVVASIIATHEREHTESDLKNISGEDNMVIPFLIRNIEDLTVYMNEPQSVIINFRLERGI